MANEKILIVDDEKPINKLVSSYITSEHFTALSAFTGREALDMVKSESPDLIILDVMLPDADGTALCLDIRKITDAPIIFLSCKTQEIDKIIALSAGGDDYMTKPFMPGELIARIKAHLRRRNRVGSMEKPNKIYRSDGLVADFDAYEIRVNGKDVSLTTKELEILKLLVENPRKVFSANQIFESVWKTMCMENDAKTVMVYISNIRKKIESDSEKPKYIINVRGVGYKFNQLPCEE
ncbi:MAG: response regulator transcription factor [Eubacteriaceae bacterium]|nr:response regulator transcription factor [Eubacteriaceae bacterium]